MGRLRAQGKAPGRGSLQQRHAYRMPRRNRFLGRWLAHGEGYPDWSLRLFDRNHASWSNDEVHETVITMPM